MGESKRINEQLLLENESLRKQLKEQMLLNEKHERIEEAMQNSEERFRVIFESAPDAIYLVKLDGVFLDVNSVVEKVLGFPKDLIVGRSLVELNLIPEYEIEKVKKSLQENLLGKKFGPEVLRLKNIHGDIILIEVSSFPVKIENELVVLGIGRDITQRIKDEKIDKENEQRLSLHFNQTPLAVIEWDLDFRVKEWNDAACQTFGYDRKEALGKKANFIVPPAFTKQVEMIWRDLVSLKGGKRSRNENITKSGEIILCEWYNTPLVDEFGDVIAVASLIENISERVRTEHMQKVLYNISNAVNTADNLYKLIGFIQAELGEIIDTKNFYIALYDEQNDTLSLPFFVDEIDKFTSVPAGKTLTKYVVKKQQSLLANTKVMDDLEKQGEIVAFGADSKIWLGVPLKTDGKVTGVLAVQSYTDEKAFNKADMKMLEFVSGQISLSIHRKKMEEELVAALKRAEESDRLKTSFLQNVSHEIRTPMNGILGFTSLLKEPGLNNKKQKNYIQIIEKSGSRMLNTINDLMDLSKVESGQMDVDIAEINLNEQIDELYTFFKPEAKNKGLKLIKNNTLPSSQAIVFSDREKVFAVLTNFVKNAIKYSVKGHVEFGYMKKSDFLEFYVKDTGIGIPQDKLKSVFDRFNQVDQSLSSNMEGNGLGLSIAKAYVEMLEGEIKVESEFGVGSRFSFTIPYKEGKSELKEVKKKTDKRLGSKDLKILIAEDDLTIRTYLKIVVKKISSDILFSQSGNETVEISRKNPDIDLILMDIKMPGIDGYEATRKIREFNDKVVIIAQTAFAFETEQEKVVAAGCNDYISKPIDRNELMEKIEKYFNN